MKFFGLSALLVSFTLAEAAPKVGLWNDANADVMVTLKKTKGKDALSNQLVKETQMLELEDADPVTGANFSEISVYRVGAKDPVRTFNFSKQKLSGDIGFRIFTGAEEGGKETYYTSQPYTLSELMDLKKQDEAEDAKLGGLDMKSEAAKKLFLDAVSAGKIRRMKALVAAGFDPKSLDAWKPLSNAPDFYKADAWEAFSSAPDSYTAKELIKLGLDINNANINNGNTLLMINAINYVFRVARGPSSGYNPAYNEHLLAEVKKLIDAGADVNAKNENGKTALDWATEQRKNATLTEDKMVSSKMEDLLKKYGAKSGKDIK
jgi:hypothetical protein